MKIRCDFCRLNFHDSHFERITRSQNEIFIVFDWAKLENFIEENIQEPIIIGQTKLRIIGITEEQIKSYYEGKNYNLIDLPENMVLYWGKGEILHSEIDDTSQKLSFEGLVNENGVYNWIEWSLKYENCEIEWNSYVTLTEWKNGKLPIN